MSSVVLYCQNVKYETGYFLWNETRLWKDQKTSLQQIWSKVTIYWTNIHPLNDQLLGHNWKVIKGTIYLCIAEYSWLPWLLWVGFVNWVGSGDPSKGTKKVNNLLKQPFLQAGNLILEIGSKHFAPSFLQLLPPAVQRRKNPKLSG